MYLPSTRRGLGAATGGQEISAAGGVLLSAAPFAGPAAPFFAIAGGIAEFLGAMGVGSGCGSTCVLSAQYANQAEALLQQNIAAYFAIASPRPLSAQTAALANFSTVWNDFVQQCHNPALGSQGQTAISERQAGSCAWKQPAASVPPWGVPPAGACWNWWAGYHDPISSDSDVYDDSVGAAVSNAAAAASSTLSSSASGSGLSAGVLAALAAAVLVGWGMTQS